MSERPDRLKGGMETSTGSARAKKVDAHPLHGRRRRGHEDHDE